MVIRPVKPVYIQSWGSVVGRKEYEGPLGELFDGYDTTDLFGADTFEKAESEMQKRALGLAVAKGGYLPEDIDLLFAGDLVNQCITSTYGLLSYRLPYIGLFGACSTAAEGLMLSALMTGSYTRRCANVTSSHYCTAERQFRFPLEYGGQRPPTAQWTVTGSGAFVCTSEKEDLHRTGFRYVPQITAVLPGIPVDGGINDANNMGAAMAPAAMDTLMRYFSENKSLDGIDLILTGDLGREGNGILADLLWSHGMDISSRLADCGKMIYRLDDKKTDVHAGGSGCGCSAVVLAADILENIRHGRLGKVLFLGTGALMNTMALYQGQNIPGIAHLVEISRSEVE
ncbi:MAG: stage V sporulation protein AD [Clostridia bacterium]|nr:stage V sporulation protein AD [Clostridia bacterium]